MSEVKVMINDKEYVVDSDMTILDAAKANGIDIPTLCHFDGIKSRANCRMCVVEVEGMRGVQPSCATKVRDGIVVHTETENLAKIRKSTLELIMSDHAVDCHHCLRLGSSREEDLDPKFCEMCFWCDCVRDGFCELQALCRKYHVDALPYIQHEHEHEIDESLGSVSRNPNKCIKCRRCVDMCNEVQSVFNLSMAGRGRDIMVVPELNKPMAESACVRCGRCVDICPCGADYMKEHIDEILYYTHSYDRNTKAMVSSDILPELNRLFKTDAITLEHVAAALKKQGVNEVYDEADFIAKANEEAARIINEKLGTETVIITNSFAVKNFVNSQFSDIANRVNTYASPQEVFGDFAGDENTKTISISARNENGAECAETKDVDYFMSAREYYRMCMRTGGAPAGRTPQKITSVDTAETLYDAILSPVEFNMSKDVEAATLVKDGIEYSVAIAHNLGQCRILLEGVQNGSNTYDVIRLNT